LRSALFILSLLMSLPACAPAHANPECSVLGPVDVPLDLSSRQVLAGTWDLSSTGMLLEHAPIQVIRIPITVPLGCVILGARVRGIQTQSGGAFEVQIQEITDDGEPIDLGRAVKSADGLENTAQDVNVEVDGGMVTKPNARYYLRIEATGGEGLRMITGAFASYSP
jgi:hypothetical protein